MKEWFSASEIIGSAGLPSTHQGVNYRAKTGGWECKKNTGKGGGKLYHISSLPQETRDYLVLKALHGEIGSDESPQTASQKDEQLNPALQHLDDRQRQILLARLAFVHEIKQMIKASMSQNKAIEAVVEAAHADQLKDRLKNFLPLVLASTGDGRKLSVRTLKGWMSSYHKWGEAGLVPKTAKKELQVPAWWPLFQPCWAIKQAYSDFSQRYSDVPSYDSVRRFLGKLSPDARETGRMNAQELKSLQSFKRLDAQEFWPNDIWQMDGHRFDAEVINPISGQIFRPEITLTIDWATRRIVGYSVNLDESAMATIDTLRDAISRVGMYKILYIDNGSGFSNDVIRDLNERLGGTISHSLPYNSQARGLVERAHKTILVKLAKTYESYIGADMDKQAGTRAHKISRQQLRDGIVPTVVPCFDEFFSDLVEAIDAYNVTPHRSLDRHQSPMELWAACEEQGWTAFQAPASILDAVARPREKRTTRRGEVNFNNGIYFLQELVNYHGEDVFVAYDYRDVSKVWIHTQEGDIIGEAILNGNRINAKPVNMINKAMAKREKGQLARLAKKAQVISGTPVEITPIKSTPYFNDDELEDKEEQGAAVLDNLAQQRKQQFRLPELPSERYELWENLSSELQNGALLTEKQENWLRGYPKTPEFTQARQMKINNGISQMKRSQSYE